MIIFLVLSPFASANTLDQLDRTLAEVPVAELWGQAERTGEPVSDMAVRAVLRGRETIGYVFLNSGLVNATGYSGKPIHILIALDNAGVIRALRLTEHHEPIVLIGIPESRITAVLEAYIGLDVAALLRTETAQQPVDIVSGATVTVMVMDDSILGAAVKVVRQLGLGGVTVQAEARQKPERLIRAEEPQKLDWATLIGDGSVRRLQLSVGDVNQAFEQSGNPLAAQRSESGEPKDIFIDLYVGLVSVPGIGLSLLGENEYRNLRQRLQVGQHAILVMGQGRYSFKGSGYVRGGIFDRFQLNQGEQTIRFHDREHKRLRRVEAESAPDFKEVGLFYLPPEQPWRADQPWRLELLVSRETGPTRKAFLSFDLSYELPEHYLTPPPTPPAEANSDSNAADLASPVETTPLWQKIWRQKIELTAILLLALGILSVVFFAQTWLVKKPRLTEWTRVGFLLFTLFVLGWYANAQLSVVNILTVFSALASGFDWSYFLMEPLIFILWGSVAAGLILWGRGAFCGWLCPFGALQELLNRLARGLGLKQIRLAWGLHERLWALKYLIFLVLFGVSLHSLAWAERLAEVEPFKTAIILKFAREWPYVLFAVAVLVAGLFIERFYCRYLCPLGAALAIPGKLRIFEWLKRYKECGNPCQNCAKQCMVQAIHPEGQINPNECLYCLHCQVVYFDQQNCYVFIQRRLRQHERAERQKKRFASASPNPANRLSAGHSPGEST